MKPTVHPRRLASLLTLIALAAGLGACGGGDDPKPKPKPTASPTPTGIPEAAVNALKLDTPRPTVEQRLGKPFDPKGRVPAQYLKGEPKRTTCTYYAVKGGKPQDFFQLCFKGGKLASKLSLVTPGGAQGGSQGE